MEGAQRQPSNAADLVLIVAGDHRVQSDLRARLLTVDLSAILVSDFDSARNAVLKTAFGLAIVDLDTADNSVALEFIATLRRLSPATAVIATMADASFDRALSALRQGACDVVLKQPEQLGYLGPRALALYRAAQAQIERNQTLVEAARLNEELLYKLTDTARRVGELRALLSQRGSSPLPPEQEQAHVLCVEDDGWLAKAVSGLLPKAFVLTSVGSGGAALDIASERPYDLALVKEALPDLPGRMVARTLSAQSPETMVMLFNAPAARRPGRIDRVEGGKFTVLLPEFSDPKQLAERLTELFQAQLARRRERRYLAEFRAENFDLLRRFADLRRRLRPLESEGGSSGGGRTNS
jgi:DNA-binding NtrC family response regulator